MLGIIVITARGGIENRIAGLEAGADQYFIKPVDARELLATIEGLWRRIKVQQVNVAIPLAENSTSNLLAWHVLPAESALGLSDGRKLPLSEREYLLISCLLDAEGAVVSKQALHAAVFPDVEQIDKHRLDVVISRLRQKTENQLAISLPIRTIFGKGFALATPRQIRASEN
jgi:DNA-binding response OmpR family regulator